MNPRRTQKPETIFETAAFDRSATSPPEKIARGHASTATVDAAGPLRSRAERCPSGRRSATGNRVSGISRFEGSNPFLSAARADIGREPCCDEAPGIGHSSDRDGGPVLAQRAERLGAVVDTAPPWAASITDSTSGATLRPPTPVRKLAWLMATIAPRESTSLKKYPS